MSLSFCGLGTISFVRLLLRFIQGPKEVSFVRLEMLSVWDAVSGMRGHNAGGGGQLRLPRAVDAAHPGHHRSHLVRPHKVPARPSQWRNKEVTAALWRAVRRP